MVCVDRYLWVFWIYLYDLNVLICQLHLQSNQNPSINLSSNVFIECESKSWSPKYQSASEFICLVSGRHWQTLKSRTDGGRGRKKRNPEQFKRKDRERVKYIPITKSSADKQTHERQRAKKSTYKNVKEAKSANTNWTW